MSSVWIFTPWLLWNIVVFVTFFQRFANGLENNLKTNTIFLKLAKFVDIFVPEYLLFGRSSKEIITFGSIH